MTEIRRRMATGAAWMVVLRLADRSIGLVSTMILARMLVPADFGLVAMAMSVVAALEIMSTFSFDLALIQNRSADRRHYDTAWTLNVLFGLANAGLLLALASPVAAYYREPRVEGIMQCLSIYAAIQGLANIGIVAFQKDMELHKEFRLGLLKKLIGFTVTIWLAYVLRNYWALLAGQVATAAAAVALSYVLHPYRPRFSLAAHRDLFRFSSWLLVNNLLTFLMHRTTDLVLGRASGSGALGIYNVAYEISNLPTTELIFPISRAVFPGYSKMAGSIDELRQAFIDVLSVTLLFVIPAGLAIAAMADPIVHVLLGDKWTEAVPLIQVLAVFGVLRASSANSGPMYLALGSPLLLALMTGLFLVVMGLGLWVLVPLHGALGAAFAMLLAGAIAVPMLFAGIARRLTLSAIVLAGAIWRPLCGALVMGASLVLVQHQLAASSMRSLVQLLILPPLGLAVYIGAVLAMWRLAGRPHGGESYLLPFGKAVFKRFWQRTS